MMNNVMVDLETLDTIESAVFPSIAAVQFDIETGEIGKIFYMNISIQDQLEMGRTISASTLQWWFEQNQFIAQKMFESPMALEKVLQEFQFWFRGLRNPTLFETAQPMNPKDVVKIWGNSARFDIGMLHHAFRKMKMEIPWNDRSNERCFKTYNKEFKDQVNLSHIEDTYNHDPIEDCKYQIKVLVEIWKHIGGNLRNLYSAYSTYAEVLRLLFKVKENKSPAIADLREQVIDFLDNPDKVRPMKSVDYRWTPHGPVTRVVQAPFHDPDRDYAGSAAPHGGGE